MNIKLFKIKREVIYIMKYDNHKKIINWAKTYLPKEYPFINEIWLYGSCARNEENYMSDVDLLVMIPEEYFEKKILRQIKTETPGYKLPDVDIHCDIGNLYNEEYNEDCYIKNIRKDAIKIYEK